MRHDLKVGRVIQVMLCPVCVAQTPWLFNRLRSSAYLPALLGQHCHPSGFDAGNQVKGKKRHLLVDTLGLVLQAIVHPANLQDRDGGIVLLTALADRFPLLAKLFADGAYQGPQFRHALATVRPQLTTEIITRSEQVKGFVVLPKRWIVERTIAWLNRCRRLAKDFENRTRYALAFVHLASIHLMLRKLCNPS